MKKLFLIFITFFPAVIKAEDNSTKYTWSYGALADTMKAMRSNCEITSADEFLEIGNWFREKGAVFSLDELITLCVNQNHKFHEIDRNIVIDGVQKKCEMPSLTCYGGYCGEQNYTNSKGCNIFISTFIKNNNLRAEILNQKKPGTYVKKKDLSDGNVVYQIFDVILHPDYWQKESINQDVNTNDENTKIYDITSGEIVDTGLHTWTNDMFFDVQTARYSQGDVRGAFVNSYIYPDLDLTAEIFSYYDDGRGIPGNATQDALHSMPHKELDIKETYGSRYNIIPQTDVEAHANGAIFMGKIATFDFLGNMLFGMNNQEAVLPNSVGRGFAQVVSLFFSWPPTLHVESQNVKHAWDFGEDLVKDNISQRNLTFKNTRTIKETEAHQIAAQEMKRIYPDASNISCTGNCNTRPGTDDIVICTATPNIRKEFVFDSICSTIDTIENTYSKPGMK